jgi:hypothetical protein
VNESEKNADVAIIIGLGSIGKNHLERLIKYYKRIVIVDPNESTKFYVENNYPDLTHSHYTNLDLLPSGIVIKFAVIANWGPDHYKTFQTLKNLGVKKFLIEKPLVSRISDLIQIKNTLNQDQVRVEVNMPWLHSDFSKKILEIQEKFGIGPICNISVSGGAKCLSTNGIHYLGLACSLFNSSPELASAMVSSDKINPRSANLEFLEGAASWKFKSSNYLQILFSNESHVQAVMTLNFKFGRVVVEGDLATVFCLMPEEQDSIDKPARTFYPSQKVMTFRPFVDQTESDGTDLIYRALVRDHPLEKSIDAFNSTEALLAMLLAGETGKLIELPISVNEFRHFLEYEWNIS